MLCATDSFGHTMCNTCGPFSITGDTIRPWGYAYGDTCSPDSIIFVLRDNVGINWSSVCITDPLGVLCWPDSMRRPGAGAGDTILIFYPRLPTGSSIGDTFIVRLSYAEDLSGNIVHEMLVESQMTVVFRHPCCRQAVPFLKCPHSGWNAWSSCSNQQVIFGVIDSAGQRVDSTRIYIRTRIDGTTVTVPPSSLILSRTADNPVGDCARKLFPRGHCLGHPRLAIHENRL